MKKEGTEEGRRQANKTRTNNRTKKGTVHKKEEGKAQNRTAKEPRKKQPREEKTMQKKRTKTSKETQIAKEKPIQKRNIRTSKEIQEERPVQNRTSRTKREAQRIEEMTIQIQKATHNQEQRSVGSDAYNDPQNKDAGATMGRPRAHGEIFYE